MPNGEIMALQPHIWIVPIVTVVLLMITLIGIVILRNSAEFGGWDLVGFLISWIGGVGFAIALIASIVNVIPFDSKYWNYYSMDATISSYTNGFEDGTGQLTGIPIFTVEDSNIRYVSNDSRLATLIGEQVSMRCEIAWVPYGSDVYSCALTGN